MLTSSCLVEKILVLPNADKFLFAPLTPPQWAVVNRDFEECAGLLRRGDRAHFELSDFSLEELAQRLYTMYKISNILHVRVSLRFERRAAACRIAISSTASLHTAHGQERGVRGYTPGKLLRNTFFSGAARRRKTNFFCNNLLLLKTSIQLMIT
jgi:hypothetical protein